MRGWRLIAQCERLSHSQIEGQLHESEMVASAGNFLRDLRDFRQLHAVARARFLAEAIPRGHAVVGNLASFHGRLEKCESLAYTFEKNVFGNFRKLRFRIEI